MLTTPVRLLEYFDGTKQSVIPMFQRPYSWTRKEWQDLWKDVTEVYGDDDSSHFMGAIVSVPIRSVPVGVHKHLIIDGQQRLITLALLLCVLRKFVTEQDQNRIYDWLVNRHYPDSPDFYKVLPTQKDRDVYRALISGDFDGDHPMKSCCDFFRTKLRRGTDENENEIDPTTLLHTIETSLKVVSINLDENDDPYVIFETLNHRGFDLTQADLARNYVLMRFKHSVEPGGDQYRVHRDLWEPLEQTLPKVLTEYLRYYFEMAGEYIPAASVYGALKRRMDDLAPEAVEAELKKILALAPFYKRIIQPDTETNEALRSRLQRLSRLKVSTCYPLLLRLFEDYAASRITQVQLVNCLDHVESYIVRRSVCGVPNNALDKRMVAICKDFQAGGGPEWLSNKLAEGADRLRWPTDAELRQAMLTQSQYGRQSTEHLLREIEESFGHHELANLDNCTIEHVMPQTMTPAWEAMIGPTFRDVHDRLVHTLGNLTLTGYNPELSNSPFAEKKELLRNSHLDLNAWIVEQTGWNEQTIVARAHVLTDKAVGIWKRPSDQAAIAAAGA